MINTKKPNSVMPAKHTKRARGGIQKKLILISWIPAFAGMTKKNIRGYTLLELLLVILLFSVIATVGLFIYNQHILDFKVSQTAQQMRQLLQAASAYYVDNQCWPNDPNCPSNILNFTQYIPLKNPSNPVNPWGNPYVFHEEGVYGKKFQVLSGKLPANIADRVVVLLPNAATDAKHLSVIAEVNVPYKFPSYTSNYLIVSTGKTPKLNNGTFFQLTFPCPINWSGRLILSYNYIHAYDLDPVQYGLFSIGSNIISTLTASEPSSASGLCQGPQRNGNLDYYSCNLTIQAVSRTNFSHEPTDLGQVSYSYIAFCVNPVSSLVRYQLFLLQTAGKLPV